MAIEKIEKNKKMANKQGKPISIVRAYAHNECEGIYIKL